VTSPHGQSSGPAAEPPAEVPPQPAAQPSLQDAVHEVETAEHEYRPPAAGTVTNVIVALVVVLLGVATLIGSWSLGVGSARTPDSGMWPLLVSIVLVVLAVVLLVTARRTNDAERFSRASWLVLAGVATMVVFVAVIQYVGFGREGWRTSIIGSLAVVAAFYAIFVVALSVPVPHLF
jgi:putative tricarboxylic transport membrane protein